MTTELTVAGVQDDAQALLDTSPETSPSRAPTQALVRGWRFLTSMRTALLLLSLLAVAAIPGSLLPQRGVNPDRVVMFLRSHPALGNLFDRLYLFDVFAAPWFAAIYLLLLLSLLGCLTPRIRLHVRAYRRPPPPTPRNLERLPVSASWVADEQPAELVALLARRLRRRGWRVAVDADGVRAERGYLRETGNLAFHIALVALLAGAAIGALRGYQADVVVVNGQGFANTPVAYDTFEPGRAVDAASLPPFAVKLDRFNASYLPTGEPSRYDAWVHWQPRPGQPWRAAHISENHPLATTTSWLTGSTKVYLTGHGYAPRVTVTSRTGQVLFDGAPPFVPTEVATYTSTGVIKVPAATPEQIGFSGFLLPTADIGPLGMGSTFPGPKNPKLVLTAYHGDLGLGAGRPQNVYTLDTSRMTQYTRGGQPASAALSPGQSWRLPDGTTLRFDRLDQFANLHVNYNPGKRLVLVATVALVAGLILSLRVRRRRVWFRVAADRTGARVSSGGLARSDRDSFPADYTRLVTALSRPRTSHER